MKLLDANVLLYAVNADSGPHEQTRRWLDDALDGTEAVAFSWVALLAFLRVTTNPNAFSHPWAVREACDQVEEWLACAAAVVIEPTPRHLSVLRGLLDAVGMGGNLTSDAHLAALALEHGAEVVTFDRDFARFGVHCTPPG